jgi:hypothetical protein
MLIHGDKLGLVNMTINGVTQENLTPAEASNMPHVPKYLVIRLKSMAAYQADKEGYRANAKEIGRRIATEVEEMLAPGYAPEAVPT